MSFYPVNFIACPHCGGTELIHDVTVTQAEEHIGSWLEDGTHFIVQNSNAYDVMNAESEGYRCADSSCIFGPDDSLYFYGGTGPGMVLTGRGAEIWEEHHRDS